MQPLHRAFVVAVSMAAGVLLFACGGTGDGRDESGPATGFGSGSGGKPAPPGGFTLPLPVIVRQPQSATIGLGTHSGANFSVAATAPHGVVITGYRWRKNGATVQTSTSSSYVIPTVQAGPPASIDVEVLSTNGSVFGDTATLTVVSNAWAPVGGRPLSSDPASQQPALSLCDGMTVAWIQAGEALDPFPITRSGTPYFGA